MALLSRSESALRETIAATLLRLAVDAHKAEDWQAAAEALVRADMPIIGEWTEHIWER